MWMKKSFIVKIFSEILVCLIILFVIESIGIYEYSRQTVGNEVISLNQAFLSQLASTTGRNLSGVRDYGEKVSVNSRLLELVSDSNVEAENEAYEIMYGLQTEYNTSHMNGLSRLETYVIGKNGINVSSYNTTNEKYTWETLSADARLSALFLNETDVVMIPTSRNEDATGIMRYSFQMIFAMKDFWEKEIQGLVVVDVSELVLYNEYKNYLEEETRIAIIDTDGRIISSPEKSDITAFYGYASSELEEIAMYKDVDDKILDGKLQLCKRISGTDWFLVKQVSEEEIFASVTALMHLIMISVVICGILATIIIVTAARTFYRRVVCIKENMKRVTLGDLTTRIETKRKDEFGEIETSFNEMVAEISNLIEMIRQGEQQKRIAEMDFMYAQINSHFIQNTLTSIRFMLEVGKNKEAEEMLFYFSKLLRQTLSHSDEFISLSQEIDILMSYVGLQSYRYQNQFEVTYQIDEDVMNCKVLTMILQPIVENSIFHNVGHKLVHICISAYREQDNLILVVEDDGVGISQEIQNNILKKDVQLNHVGLRNVNERILLYYGEEHGLIISNKESGGTKIIFTIPINEEDEKMEGGQIQ